MTDAKLGNCQTADCLDLSVVIPVYRSVSSLAALVDRFLPVLESITPISRSSSSTTAAPMMPGRS